MRQKAGGDVATYRKVGDKWRVEIRRKGHPSRSANFATKAQAKAWAATIEADAVSARLGQPARRTVAQALQRYAKEVSSLKRGSRWECIRLKKFERELPFAQRMLGDVGPSDCAAWRDAALHRVAPASVHREQGLLASVWDRALKEWQWVPSNPWRSVSLPKRPAARQRRINAEELAALVLRLGYAGGHLAEMPSQRVGAALVFAVETAMRAGEICGLTWAHVDAVRRVAHLPQTKNGHARDVPLSSAALAVLADLPRDSERCFGLSAGSLDALFRKARGRVAEAMPSVAEIHFHDSRREALTRLSALFDVMQLARISGHRDLRILLTTYYAPDAGELALKLP